jgi:hypothetical protein
MNTPLFLSSEEMDRQLAAAKRLRSEFLRGLVWGAGRKLAAHTRNIRMFGAFTSKRMAVASTGKRMAVGLACALPLGLAAFYSPFAKSNTSDEYWRADVTVVAIAPDGTWGTATDALTNRAVARAIDDCKAKYASEIGCGYRSTFVRQGWSLAFRCGTENILVAEQELTHAQWAAFRQERELRTRYVPDMPACVRTLTVDPQGRVGVPKTDFAGSL